MEYREQVAELVAKARSAQAAYESFTQEQVDAIVKAIAKVVYDNAELLARMAVDETRLGVYENKVAKNKGKASIIWWSLKGKKSVGVISRNEETGIVEVARAVGVVGAVTPCTNPIVTPMCNAMFALKGRNAIILAPHPRALKCNRYLVDLFAETIRPLGAPENLIQTIDEASNDLSGEIMRQSDVVVATGGMGMVKAAYGSGKPAFGVGVGNVQCIIDRGVDLDEATDKVIAGRIFDNGIICSGEQTIIAHKDGYEEILELLAKKNCLVVRDPKERDALREAVFPDGVMNKYLVGVPAKKVADAAGLSAPDDVQAIFVEAETYGAGDLLSKEKMCPVVSTYRYDAIEQAVEIAQANLNVDGRGHSVSLHTNSPEVAEYVANTITVSRVLINQICTSMNGGSFYNGLTPTTTLGCGSWGNNSISENLSFRHLLNITRIAYYKKDNYVPTPEELWGD